MTTPERPTVGPLQPAAVAESSDDDAIAREVLALHKELEHQAEELSHEAARASADVAARDAADVTHVQASEQAVVDALRQMAERSADEAEQSVANSLGAPANPQLPVAKQ
jgi:hypothetical protein